MAFVVRRGKLWRFDQIGEYEHFWYSHGESLDAIEDKAEEDNIFDANLDVYLEASEEEPEAYNQSLLTLIFRTEDAQVNRQSSVGMAKFFSGHLIRKV